MGGAVGLIASQEIHNLASFVCVEGNLVSEDCGIVSRNIADQPLSGFVADGFEEFIADLEASPQIDLRAWAGWAARCEPAGLRQAASSLVEWSDSGKLLELFRSLPTKAYVYGMDSSLSHILPLLPEITARGINGCGHFPMVDNPSRFYSLVADLVLDARQRELAGTVVV
jgi:pimeloyl-ACP methyl ester carboxylesterase